MRCTSPPAAGFLLLTWGALCVVGHLLGSPTGWVSDHAPAETNSLIHLQCVCVCVLLTNKQACRPKLHSFPITWNIWFAFPLSIKLSPPPAYRCSKEPASSGKKKGSHMQTTIPTQHANKQKRNHLSFHIGNMDRLGDNSSRGATNLLAGLGHHSSHLL